MDPQRVQIHHDSRRRAQKHICCGVGGYRSQHSYLDPLRGKSPQSDSSTQRSFPSQAKSRPDHHPEWGVPAPHVAWLTTERLFLDFGHQHFRKGRWKWSRRLILRVHAAAWCIPYTCVLKRFLCPNRQRRGRVCLYYRGTRRTLCPVRHKILKATGQILNLKFRHDLSISRACLGLMGLVTQSFLLPALVFQNTHCGCRCGNTAAEQVGLNI